MDFGFASVGAIVVLCYLIGEIAKRTPIDNRWIPVIVGVAGAALGVVGMYTIPDYPATDILTALAVGVVSGLSATGANQIVKQSTKD